MSPTNPVVVNNVNPGFCHSNLNREMTFPLSLVVTMGKAVIARTTEQGSRTIVHAAFGSPDAPKELHGRYLNKCAVGEEDDWLLNNPETEIRLWVSEHAALRLSFLNSLTM